MTDKLTIYVTPFFKGEWSSANWHGEFKSINGAPAGAFSESEIAEVLYQADTGDDWDGKCAAVLRLKDGRLVAYETWWGPTGDGFCEDAYGGDADVYFASPEHLNELILIALTDEGRRLLGIPAEGLA